MSYIYIYTYMEHIFLMFLDHTQRRSTVGRTPLDEWSARRRDLYLTTHDTHNRQISHLLRSWVRIPPGAWIFVCCECRVLSGRGLCDELITLPEKSYRLCCVVVCDLETSRMVAPYIYDISRLRVNAIRKTSLYAYSNKEILDLSWCTFYKYFLFISAPLNNSISATKGYKFQFLKEFLNLIVYHQTTFCVPLFETHCYTTRIIEGL